MGEVVPNASRTSTSWTLKMCLHDGGVDELILVKESDVTVVEVYSNGWWCGSYNWPLGLFP